MSTTTPNSLPHTHAVARPPPNLSSRSGRHQRQVRPDSDPRSYLMGGPDEGVRHDVMGESDTRFVDWLFTGVTAR